MNALLAEPAMRLFAVTYLILVVKMIAMSGYTSFLRIRRGVYAAPEDYALQGLPPRAGSDPDVERVRRAHRNDLENILPFFAVGLFYALTGPSLAAARVCFIGYALARVLHSIFYVLALQPHRTLAYGAGLFLTLAMLFSALARLV